MNVLRELVLPALVAERSASRRITVWSAGCSLGEEAYTLAILINEALGSRQGFQVTVVGSDLDEPGLERARLAEYNEWSVRTLDAEQRARFFDSCGNRFILKPRYRRGVHFQGHNLADASAAIPGPGDFDLVLCRNVAMYLSEAALAAAYATFARAIGSRGLLILSPSDPRPTEVAMVRRRPLGYPASASSLRAASGS